MPLEPHDIVPGSLRFGDDFELDRGACQLRRSGCVIKLERIPMEVLLCLVQQRGKLVSREHIVEKIWGKDVYLDTDNSINGAIRKVRHVLKDDPEQPRFIQTITGKGYRFIAPVIDPDTEAATAVPPPQSEAFHRWSSRPNSIRLGSIGLGSIGLGSIRQRWPLLLGAMATIALLMLVGLHLRRSQSPPQAPRSEGRIMLAVLPFENLTGDPAQEYFSDGMTEEMITQMGSLDADHLGVIARTSVMHYKNSREQLQQIARELGVQYVLEGSVRRDANKVRITAQLIQMKDQTHLWARQYDRDPRDLLVLQSEIGAQICGEIQAALGDRKPIPLSVQPTLTPNALEAYNLYLKGQYFWNKRTVVGFQDALGYFQQATLKDPGYARAYAGLADSYALIAGYSGAPSADYASRARAAALRALELDDRLPEAHAALALIVQNNDYDWQTAETEFKRAIQLNPSYAVAHQWYAEHLTWRGQFDQALRESEIARRLDPLSLIIAADNGAILLYSRRYDQAIAQFNAVRELDPDFSRARMILYAYVEKGMFADAIAVAHKLWGPTSWRWSTLAYVYGRAGQPREAQYALGRLIDSSRQRAVDPMLFVFAYLGIGNNDQAIKWLQKAYLEHSNSLTGLKVDPAFDPLRSDPRFQGVLRHVGLVN